MDPKPGIRIFLLTALVLFGFGALLSRLYDFQITQRTYYQELVPGDREVTVREPGIRGAIKDRNGIELARNRRNYEVYFDLEEIHKSYRRQHEQDAKRDVLTNEQGMPRLGQETDIARIVNTWIIPKLAELDVAKNYSANAMRTHFITHRGLVPFSYNTDLNYEQFARLAEHNVEVPGVYLDVRPQREYPYEALASHIIGYTQQWEKGDIPDDARRRFNHYIGEEKGKMGLEATLDPLLRGPEGSRTLVKNDKGKITGMIDYREPKVGADVTLTLDAPVQYLVSKVLRRTGRAAGVVMDVRTGEVLAMASVPDYDPNDFIPSIAAQVYADYRANPSSPFTDRGTSGFAPGSTFKLATATAGALNGLAQRSFSCEGFVSYGNYKPACWLWNMKRGRHGTLGLSEALQRSCNPYFYKLGNTMGSDRLVSGLTMLGFGQPTGVEIPNEGAGRIPGTRAWKQANRGRSLTPGDVAQLSIGQGDSLATPLQLCAMVACIANGGRYYQPRIVKKAVMENGTVLVEDRPKLRVDLIKEGVKPADLELIRKGMWMAVNQPGGTAGRAKIPDVEVAAKTGTAQTADDGKRSHNSWTVAFAPYDEPRYAVVVLVQNGKSGGKVCGPLVHLILRGLLARDDGMRLPLAPLEPFYGNRDPIEEIELPEDVLAAIETTDVGETGDEAGDPVNVQPAVTMPVETPITPEPTITPEIDEEGSVIPRAIPVEDP
ncbi:penicillin-binding protein 2 [Haloferula rosea]|uniref:Penicillin-binding protein 2 n=1 Tax=Haloferula rosea TaxID=490093 RepID=A0A934VBI5_9BACT|nr:penicillin-binding protein 2 [Haloferula rosea]MBK1827418.1 penicillin-binding protein 2 [Haloferula rosea]